MRSRARIHGEPLNPIFALLPVALLGLAVLTDLAAAMIGLPLLGTAAFWDLGAAMVASLPATAVALIDVSKVPAWSQAKNLVVRYGLTTIGLTVLILFVWSARLGGDHHAGPVLVLLEIVALAAGIASAWRARELVVGHDVPDRGPPPPPRMFPRPKTPSEMATVRLRPLGDRHRG